MEGVEKWETGQGRQGALALCMIEEKMKLLHLTAGDKERLCTCYVSG